MERGSVHSPPLAQLWRPTKFFISCLRVSRSELPELLLSCARHSAPWENLGVPRLVKPEDPPVHNMQPTSTLKDDRCLGVMAVLRCMLLCVLSVRALRNVTASLLRKMCFHFLVGEIFFFDFAVVVVFPLCVYVWRAARHSCDVFLWFRDRTLKNNQMPGTDSGAVKHAQLECRESRGS